MPDYPNPGGDWTTWIIGTLMAVISAVVGTATYLAKLIESKYQNDVIELHKSIQQLNIESKACQEDRYSLAIRVASLEAVSKKNANDISDMNHKQS